MTDNIFGFVVTKLQDVVSDCKCCMNFVCWHTVKICKILIQTLPAQLLKSSSHIERKNNYMVLDLHVAFIS